MAIQLDNNGVVNVPNVILRTRSFENIGAINNFFDLTYTENFNSANEISFSLYKENNTNIWDEITDHKILYVPEYHENFEITISLTDENCTMKKITGISLCESELSQTLLRNIEINTENDIARDVHKNVWDNYDINFPTIFYRDWTHPEKYDWSNRNGKNYSGYTTKEKQMVLFHSSLIHRLLEKTPHYSIGVVQDTLWNIQRTFTFSDTDIYNAFNNIAEEIGCIFIYDSLTRTINAYDLYSTCTSCGYRGDYSDICPECGSENTYGQYGEDTTILVDKENLATSISLEAKSDSLKNTFMVNGGDDVINSVIRTCNPNGTQYITFFSDETLSDMPDELREKIMDYDKDYDFYLNDKNYEISKDAVDNYNSVVNYVKDKFSADVSITEKYNLVETPLIGYEKVSAYIYEAIDLYYFINTSMMPTINIEGIGIDDAIDNIKNGFANGLCTLDSNGEIVPSSLFKNTVALSSPTTAIKSTVNNTIKNTAKLFCSTAYYDIDAQGDYTYNSITNIGTWNGTITITSLTEIDEDTGNKKSKSTNLTINVNDDLDLFLSQQICFSTYSKDKLEDTQILSLNMSDGDFKNQLQMYSLDELEYMLNKFEGCLGVINNLKDQSSNYTGNDGNALIERYYTFYSNRLSFITKELEIRNSQLESVESLYSISGIGDGELNKIKNEVQSFLNFESYVGDLYKTFCSYRREDTYSNSNYISDGLTDSELVQNAKQLLKLAKNELMKAGTLQWALSSTINNLLLLEEFKPILNKFKVGNWIRVRIDETIYKLRLLSYNVSYDNLENISVEFSTVENKINSISDVKSVLDSVSSLASSYTYVEKQAEKSDTLNSMYKDWVNDGLKATLVKYANADNQTLVIDSNGLLARAWDFETNDYSKYQLKVINNGLYTTHNSWKTIDTGIGRINYYDPILGKYIDDYGIIAKTLVGHLILGENLVIANCNDKNKSTVVIDADGITLDGGSIRWTKKLPTSSVEGLDDTVQDFIDSIGDLQSQIDGEITSWFEEYEPTITNAPASTWTTDDEKIKHEGDLFYNTATGAAYRYIYNSSSKRHEWSVITDTAITEALEKASKAQDTADGKRRVFVVQPTPPYDIGDLWSQGDEGDLMKCKIPKSKGQYYSVDEWEKASKYTDDTKALIALEKAQKGIEDANAVKSYVNGEFKTSMETAYQKYSNTAVSDFDKAVAEYLQIPGATTIIGGNHVISPYIEGGYLNITNGNKQVIVDPSNQTKTGYIFAVKNGKEFTVGIKSDGTTNVKGGIIATSLDLSNCSNKVSTDYISGLSKVATSGKATDLSGLSAVATSGKASDLTDISNYVTSSGLSTTLSSYLTTDSAKNTYVANTSVVISDPVTDTKTGITTQQITVGNKTFDYVDSGDFICTNIGIGKGSKPTDTSTGTDTYVLINKDGLLTADNAVIRGTIYATNGYFSGKLTSNEGSIGGWSLTETGMSKTIKDQYDYLLPVYENGVQIRWHAEKLTIKDIVGLTSEGVYGFETQGYDDIGLTCSRVVDGGIGLWRAYNSFTIRDDGEFDKANHTINKDFSSYMSIYTTPMNSLKYFGAGIIFNGNISDSVSFLMNGNEPYLTLNKNLPVYSKKTYYGLYKTDTPTIILHKPVECFGKIYTHDGMIFENSAELIFKDSHLTSNKFFTAPRVVSRMLSLGNFIIDGTTYQNYFSVGYNSIGNGVRIGVIGATQWEGQGIKWDLNGNMIVDGYATTSDERLKCSFNTLDNFDDAFMHLEPTIFKYKHDKSNKNHFGFKAQNVKKVLNNCGLNEEDYFILSKTNKQPTDEDYHGIDEELQLSYQEFTAWNTHMIQKVINENNEFKQRIKKLETLLGLS